MRAFQILFLFFCMALVAFADAQSLVLTGKLCDSVTYMVPAHAEMSFTDNEGRVKRVTAADDGSFRVIVPDSGRYAMEIRHPDFMPFSGSVEIGRNSTDTVSFFLLSDHKMLNEIVIINRPRIQIRKDTVEFTTDSFRVRQFDPAGLLLKKIPGIRIENGNIIYHGRIISKISLDGVPFLHMDPNTVLRLLRGSDLDKVQLFDIRDNPAIAAGMDESVPEKGINLTLKESAKNGYYGKIAGGLGKGDAGHWDHSGDVNSFSDKRRIAVFARTNNTADISGIGEPEAPGQASQSNGLPEKWATGIHYDRRLLKQEKLSLNINYNWSRNRENIAERSVVQNLIPVNAFHTDAVTQATSLVSTHNGDLDVKYIIDKSSWLQLSFNTSLSAGSNSTQTRSSSYQDQGVLLNYSNTALSSGSSLSNTQLSLAWQKEFSKPGRVISFVFSPGWNENKTTSEQASDIVLQAAGSIQDIRQHKEDHLESSFYNMRLSYSEPLWKQVSLQADFKRNKSSSAADNETYNVFMDAGHHLTDTLNPLYSNHYSFKSTRNQLRTSLKIQTAKIYFLLGGMIAGTAWDQGNSEDPVRQKQHFLNILPYASFRINPNGSNVFNAEYIVQTTEPQLNQIQPLVNNSDPFHLLSGNPDLTQSYTHNLRLACNNTRPAKNRYFNTSLNLSLTQNAISYSQRFNADGQEFYRYENVDGNYSGYLFAGYGWDLFPGMQLSFNENITVQKSMGILNTLENTTLSKQLTSGISASYRLDTLFYIRYTCSAGFSASRSSLLPHTTNQAWSILQNIEMSGSLPRNCSAGMTVSWATRSKLSPDENTPDMILWNMYAGKYILKNQSLMIKLFCYDILGQNKGFYNALGPNLQSVTTFNTFTRYLMLGAIWNFTKRKGS